MRIIAGKFRRRKLLVGPGDVPRPITDKVKEVLFERIEQEFPGSHIADVFAGTGALGLEALSRGARTVAFLENDRQAYHLLQQNVAALGVEDIQARIREGKKISLTLFGDEETNKYVYAGSVYKGNDIFFSGISVIESIRDKKWKLIREKIDTEGSQKQEYYELYDIENDPQELYNLYETEKDVASRLLRVLEEWSRQISQ